jgi:hypothetical protein
MTVAEPYNATPAQDFSQGDFTLKFSEKQDLVRFTKGDRGEPVVQWAIPMSSAGRDDGWREISVVRKIGGPTFIHTTEEVDGQQFVVTIELDDDRKLVRKTMVRADMVKG